MKSQFETERAKRSLNKLCENLGLAPGTLTLEEVEEIVTVSAAIHGNVEQFDEVDLTHLTSFAMLVVVQLKKLGR